MFQRRKDHPTSEQHLIHTKSLSPSRSTEKQHHKQPRTNPRHDVRPTSPKAKSSSLSSPIRRNETTAIISGEETDWNEAHRRTCLAHKSLFASLTQVMELFTHISDLPQKPDDVVIWNYGQNLPSAAATVRRRLDETKSSLTVAGNSTNDDRRSSWAKRLLAGAAKGASTLILGADPYNTSEVEDLGNDDDTDNQARNHGSANSFIFDVNDRIINMDLVSSCLQELEQALHNQPPRVLLFNGSESNIQPSIADSVSFETWCRQVAVHCKDSITKSLLANMDSSTCRFLGELLVAKNLAMFAPDRQDRIVLGNTKHKSTPNEVETMVTMFDLQINEESMTKNIEAWTARADACGRSALEARRNGRTRQAAMDLKRRQMLLQQVTNTQNCLLQLEQIRHTLEHAQTHSQVIECLQSSATVLQSMRTDPTALHALRVDIDNTRADVEHATTNTAIHPSLDGTTTDEDLLIELGDDGFANNISKDDEEQLLGELKKLEQTPSFQDTKQDPSQKKKLMPASTGTLSLPSKATRDPALLVGATTGISKRPVVPPTLSSTKLAHGRIPPKTKKDNEQQEEEEEDEDILDLERRLLALQSPPSSTTTTSKEKKRPTTSKNTLSAVAF